MRYLKGLSIRNKLIAILLLLSVIALALAFSFVIIHDIATFKSEMIENGFMIARVIGEYSIVDLTFQDAKASTETLARLNSIPDVDCAFLYDTHGNLFSLYAKSECTAPAVQPASVQFRENALQLFQPVQDKDRKYGTIYLSISNARLKKKINSYLLTMISLAAVLIVISFLLAVRLQGLISKPLVHLAEATEKISEERDYSVRMQVDTGDELGVLFRGFNRMVSQLERRKEERDRAEQALRESEDRYRVLVESSPEAIFLEKDERIVYANPAALMLSGYASIQDLETIKLESLFKCNAENVALRSPTNGKTPVEASLMRRDGSRAETEVMFVKTIHQGSPAVQCLARDITESKNLRQAAQRMERLAALGTFSAMLAHEMRNSMGSIALNVRTLSERLEVPEIYKKNLQNMELGVQRIHAIIKGILDYARPARPKLQNVGVNRVVDSSILLFESELEQSQISIGRQYDPEDPEVAVDLNQITQVFVNLFLNAKQSMDHGGKITVTTKSTEDGVRIQVADTGKGIPAENVEKIFDPFFTANPRGIGLGLAVVARILEQHNSQIFVESQMGVGTVFTIRFPAVRKT